MAKVQFGGDVGTVGGGADALGPYAGAGAAVVGGAINYYTAKYNTDRTIAGNKELAQYAYANDRAMYEDMKEYNSPTAQMARYKAAGLNPHLIYGQGSSGNVQSTPKYNAPRVEYGYAPPVDLPSVISAYQDVALKDAQTDNVLAQTRNVDAKTAVEVQNELLRGKQATGQAAKNEVLIQYGLDTAQAELQLKRSQLTTQQKQQMSLDLKNEFQTYANQWAKYGITGRDALLIRVGVKVMDQLGIDYSWLADILRSVGTNIETVNAMTNDEK